MATSIASIDLPSTCFTPQRYRPGHLGTWSGHLAFANDLIGAMKPSLVVELGTHWGESYFTFCQSIFENSLDCRSYAVDHWLGEAHSGLYGDDVFEDVKRYNDAHYAQFSYLLRMSFDDALQQFGDQSIDLLHIDGFHSYEAVAHDFRSWLPKVRPGGVILIHDINARHADFGVWRLWSELRDEFTDTFEFHHCWGLGIIQKRSNALTYPPLLNLLFHSSAEVEDRIRRYYFLYASHLDATLRTGAETSVQIYPFGDNGYCEETSLIQQIGIDQSEKLTFYLAGGLGDGPLRIDPATGPCVIDVDRIAIIDAAADTILWQAEGAESLLSALTVSGPTALLPNCRAGVAVSYGDDPRLLLPAIEAHEGPVRIEISLRLVSSYEAIYEALQFQAREPIHRMDREVTSCRADIAELTAELRQSQSERMLLAFEMKQAIFHRHAAERELKRVEADGHFAATARPVCPDQSEIESARREVAAVSLALESKQSEVQSMRRELESNHGELQAARRENELKSRELEAAQQQLQSAHQEAELCAGKISGLEADLVRLSAALHEQCLILAGVMQSVSWRATEPARRVMRVLRAARHAR